MSTAMLNVWVTGIGQPCRIDDQHRWFIHVLTCEGEVLRWCDRIYTNLEAKCGHLEIEIPPGCYIVCATWSPGAPNPVHPTSLGNQITHVQVVRANCCDHVCVTLFPPTFHWCGIWWILALRNHQAQRSLPAEAAEAANRAAEAVEALLRLIPIDPLTEQMMALAPKG